MEDLVKSMKNMFKELRKDEDNNKLNFLPKYNPIVKVTEWYLPQEAEPKDKDPYQPPGGNYFLSTYRRLGSDDTVTMETTTQAMLRQICQNRPVAERHKTLVNADSQRLDKVEDPMTYTTVGSHLLSEEMDLTTSYSNDYRHPHPYRNRVRCVLQKSPEGKYGRVSMFNRSNICETKYLDDNLYNRPGRVAKLDTPPFV